jgi:hypothetical protein
MLYTIGHSTLTSENFIKLMGTIPTLVDVRSHPGSRAHPQFNKGAMMEWMPASGKNYEWWPGLGGWDVRHGQDEDLRERMTTVGVDLAVYSGGMFPKQRIAGYRLDMELIQKQLESGCNCAIHSKVREKAEKEVRAGVLTLSDNSVVYLSQLHSRLIKDRERALAKKLGEQLSFEVTPETPLIKELHPLSLAYKKLISSSSKLSKEISPCKWMAKECSDCGKPALAPQWWSQGLYDYTYFMTLPEFKESAHELMRRSQKEDVATCCCESLYYKCHRSLIADYCMFCGVDSIHVNSSGKPRPHSAVIGDRLQRYPTKVLQVWEEWKSEFER